MNSSESNISKFNKQNLLLDLFALQRFKISESNL